MPNLQSKQEEGVVGGGPSVVAVVARRVKMSTTSKIFTF